MEPRPPRSAPRGRGATRNVKSRFDRFEVEPLDDELVPDDDDRRAAGPPTTLIEDRARSIIATNDSPDVPFEQSINPYRGCEHGCSYCFARPTHAYLGFSPGLDFETKILFKPDAPELLRRELGRRGYVCRPIALGSNTDPYQPAERELRLTRAILEVLDEHRHPVSIVTKSALVARDLDLLAPMAREHRASVHFSITTLDPELARRMEPRAAAPARRLGAMARVVEAGVPVGVLVSPIVPGLNDAELESILEAAAGAGATGAAYLVLRLPHEVRELFLDWLRAHYPAREAKVLGRLREMRGGELNDPRFDSRHTGRGAWADLLRERFAVARRRLGLDAERAGLDCSRFRVPGRPGPQGRLFD